MCVLYECVPESTLYIFPHVGACLQGLVPKLWQSCSPTCFCECVYKLRLDTNWYTALGPICSRVCTSVLVVHIQCGYIVGKPVSQQESQQAVDSAIHVAKQASPRWKDTKAFISIIGKCTCVLRVDLDLACLTLVFRKLPRFHYGKGSHSWTQVFPRLQRRIIKFPEVYSPFTVQKRIKSIRFVRTLMRAHGTCLKTLQIGVLNFQRLLEYSSVFWGAD